MISQVIIGVRYVPLSVYKLRPLQNDLPVGHGILQGEIDG